MGSESEYEFESEEEDEEVEEEGWGVRGRGLRRLMTGFWVGCCCLLLLDGGMLVGLVLLGRRGFEGLGGGWGIWGLRRCMRLLLQVGDRRERERERDSYR